MSESGKYRWECPECGTTVRDNNRPARCDECGTRVEFEWVESITDDGLRADGGTKRMRVPSVLVDCRDCDAVIEVDARTFDLAVERGSGTFLCDDCRDESNRSVDTESGQ